MATKSAKRRGDHRVQDLSGFGKNALPNKKYEEIRQVPMPPPEDYTGPRRRRNEEIEDFYDRGWG